MDIVIPYVVGAVIAALVLFLVMKPAGECLQAGGLPVAGIGRVVCLSASDELQKSTRQ